MSISSTLQKHYHKKTTLSIDNSLDLVRNIFVKLATTDIVCGHLLFTWSHFRFSSNIMLQFLRHELSAVDRI
jgi:hypothetical protein